MRISSRIWGAFAAACSWAVLLVCSTSPALAHHGFAVEFDRNSPVTLNGQVTKMEFMNPHIYIYLDVKGDDGKVVNWSLEGGPPNVLYRQGWRKDTLKPGDVITIKAYRARDGSNLGSLTTFTFADGRPSPTDKAPQQ